MASGNIKPGSHLGKYQVIEHIATGGMGAVYKAVDTELNRLVALKILPTQLAADSFVMERFRREARNAARLNHPNIVTLFEFNREIPNLYFLAFEFIRGVDLAKYVQHQGQLRPEEVRRILVQTARALGHAFQHGIVHRDVKPSNLMLARITGKTVVKLTDMGLAISKGEEEFRVTREGNTVGTIDYLSPEQARDSQAVDTRSDIYSLGCTAYHLLAGKPPFGSGGLGERLFKHLETPPSDVRQFNPAVSAGFWTIIDKMLAKKPEDRYPNPNELLRALKHTAAENRSSAVGSSRRPTEHMSTAATQLSIPRGAANQPPDFALAAPPSPAATTISAEQIRSAAALYERAVQVLIQGSGDDYARELLDNSLKLDPLNLPCRKTLRVLNRRKSSSMLGRWFGSLNVLAIKSKMRLSRAAGDWRSVFAQGEQLLAHNTADADTHLELAETATEAGLTELARWFLQQAQQDVPDNAELLRALARLHEHLQEWKQALAVWHQVVALDPANCEAHRKLNDLAAQELLASGQFHR